MRFSKIFAIIFAALIISAGVYKVCFAQTVLKPHFTDQSKKIVVPKGAHMFPEIHEGLIAIGVYPNILYVNTKGEYVFGMNFPFTRGNDYRTAYFSGGAMMAWRSKPGTYTVLPFIIYPNGKYREFPTGVKKAGMPYDIFSASEFNEGYAIVQKGDMFNATQVFIDKDGKEVFPALTSKVNSGAFGGDMTVYPLRENRRLYYNAALQKYGYADAKGAIAIKPQFDKAQNFSEGLAAVMVKEGYTEKWGFIDLSGKMVIPATYKIKPGRFSEGLAAVRIGESESEYEMAYIDKTGKRVIENKPWDLNEFHGGYAWVGTGCNKLFVMDKNFKEVRNLTADFYGSVCMFRMKSKNGDWGIDFPNGMQAMDVNGQGIEAGDIFAPDGTVLFKAVDNKGVRVNLYKITEGDLMFCEVRFINEPRLKEKDIFLECFINKKGEIVYYIEEGFEGYEGPKPVQVK